MAGFVYIMSNPLFSRIKIGKSTKDPSKDRLSDLNHETGNPENFKCEYYAFVGDENALERAVHKKFESRRPNPKREFFEVSVLEAMEAIRILSEDHGGLKHEEVGYREFKKIKYKDGSKYEGETLNGKPHGQGTLKHKMFHDGSDWNVLSKSIFVIDDYSKDIPEDFSVEDEERFTEIEYKYVGEWKNGYQNGQGTKSLTPVKSMVAGILYEGEWKNGKADGFGSDGNYVGEFKDDEYHGHGTYTTSSSDFTFKSIRIGKSKTKYIGQFRHGERYGEGEETEEREEHDEKISYYKGGWKKDEKHGMGFERITRVDGKVIEFKGQFDEGFREDGTELIKHHDGKVTELTAKKWDDGSPVGFVTEIIKYVDGNTSEYKGDWHFIFGGKVNSHGNRINEGTENYTYNDGTIRKRTGNWYNGNLSGQGTEIIKNGDSIISEYTGEWLAGKKMSEEAQVEDVKKVDEIKTNNQADELIPKKSNQLLNWLWVFAGGVFILWWLDTIRVIIQTIFGLVQNL